MNLNPIPSILDAGANLWGTIFGSRVERHRQDHDKYNTAHGQLAAEFTSYRHNRNWWDSLVDGLNRLPRPVSVFGVFYYFYLAYSNPDLFLEITNALVLIPVPAWTILGMILGFYFGGRMQIKSQDFRIDKEAIAQRRTVVQQVERNTDNIEVEGSTPSSPTTYDPLARFEEL